MAGYFQNYTAVFIATLVGAAVVLAAFVISLVFSPRSKSELKGTPYECGMPPIGKNWSQFNVRYYLFAILFLIFDVEAVFLFPWAVVFAKASALVFYEMIAFIGVLLFGLLYGWKKGILQWR